MIDTAVGIGHPGTKQIADIASVGKAFNWVEELHVEPGW